MSNANIPARSAQVGDGILALLARLVGAPLRATLLASATRTATTSSVTLDLSGFRSVLLFLNITAASGTGGLCIFVEYLDPASWTWNRLWNYPSTAARLTTAGLQIAAVGPGLGTQSGGVNQAGFSSSPLASQLRITINHGDASNYTYSVGYEAL